VLSTDPLAWLWCCTHWATVVEDFCYSAADSSWPTQLLYIAAAQPILDPKLNRHYTTWQRAPKHLHAFWRYTASLLLLPKHVYACTWTRTLSLTPRIAVAACHSVRIASAA
jgi:hypothetical protein